MYSENELKCSFVKCVQYSVYFQCNRNKRKVNTVHILGEGVGWMERAITNQEDAISERLPPYYSPSSSSFTSTSHMVYYRVHHYHYKNVLTSSHPGSD